MNRVALFLIFICQLATAQHVPTFEEVISLRGVNTVSLSSDGKHIAFTVQTTDWHDNRFDTEIWLSKNGGRPFQPFLYFLLQTRMYSKLFQWEPEFQTG